MAQQIQAQALAQQIAQQYVQDQFQPVQLQSSHILNFPYAMYDLNLINTRSFKQFQHEYAHEFSYVAKLKNVQPDSYLQSILPSLSILFDSLLEEIALRYEPHDLVRIFITHETLTACNIVVGPHFLRDMTSQLIIHHIGRTIRSNNFIPADRHLQINVAAVRNLKGSGPHRCINNVWKNLKQKHSIIAIANEDHLCMPRALAVAIARYEYVTDPTNNSKKKHYRSMRANDRGRGGNRHCSLQKKTALQYISRAGLPSDRQGILQDIPLYEKALQTGITLISSSAQNKRIYTGNTEYTRQVLLYHVVDRMGCGAGHFAVIASMTGLLCRSYYCSTCDVGYNNRKIHHCKVKCPSCDESNEVCPKKKKDHTTAAAVYCSVCNVFCRSPQCLQRHLEKNMCQTMFFCPKCHVGLRGARLRHQRQLSDHMCGEAFCGNCQRYHLDHHQCHMRATTSKSSSSSSWRYIFYDFECMQEGDSDHIPNLVVSHSICHQCEAETHVTPDSRCDTCGSRCSKCDMLDNKKNKGFLTPPCSPQCGKREVIFRGSNTANNFCDWLFHRQHRNCIVIAHNAKAYDSYFLYSFLIHSAFNPNIIFSGSKIMYCHIGKGLNIKLLDSVNFLPMPLANLPKSFGLVELKKGYFPHLLNTFNPPRSSFETLPDIKYYAPDNMSEAKRSEFLEWYKANQSQPFHLYDELLAYCRSDVNILLSACWKFRALLLQVTQGAIDPFNFITIASVAMATFRTCFLPETWKVLLSDKADDHCTHDALSCQCSWNVATKKNGCDPDMQVQLDGDEVAPLSTQSAISKQFVSSPIALLPPQGYARRDFFSKQCTQWIHIFEKIHRVRIQSALSSEGEKRVLYWDDDNKKRRWYSLDGYYEESGIKHALEFNGCYFHGCPRCYPHFRSTTMVGNKSLAQRFQDTLRKGEILSSDLGYRLHTMWACDFQRKLLANPQWRQWAGEVHLQDPIDLRDCYYGGRTNALVLDSQTPARLLDFCSLYPSQMKYQTFPQGHPKRMARDIPPPQVVDCYAARPLHCPLLGRYCEGKHVTLPYFGVMKAKILPPKHLYHPVLPSRCNGKLMFPLCQTCALRESKGYCLCKDEDRALLGTWCTPEVEAALSVGYTLVHVYEVLHWEETNNDLFADYINLFLRLKAQASGWPPDVITKQDKDDYIRQFEDKEGIRLVKEEVKKNPGLRTLAKLLLNSLYGKFGQRVNMKKSKFVTSSKELYDMLSDVSKSVNDFHVLTPSTMLIEYSQAREFQNIDPKTNVVISAFCSSYARLQLWQVMYSLGRRVLYHDTDSVIFTTLSPSDWQPPVGDCLGDLTDELQCSNVGCSVGAQCPGHWITEFVSCGPKNYAYRLNTGQVICKVRGFTLNYDASQIVNFKSMREALHAWKNNIKSADLITVMAQIRRHKHQARIFTKTMRKQYSVVYNKRLVKKDFTTRPFGYCTRLRHVTKATKCRL